MTAKKHAAKKAAPKGEIVEITDYETLSSVGLSGVGYQAAAGDWTGDVRSTREKAQAELDEHLVSGTADTAESVKAVDEGEEA